MSELVAVVDLGSTAVRLLLARIVPGSGYRVLVEERVATRQGGGRPGKLARAAIEETLRAVHRFFARYSSRSRGPRVVAVATSAVRDAANREHLLGPLRRFEGIEVRVLSARDEARLGVDAALNSLPFTAGVVADLGGASLQLSRVRDRKVMSSASLPLGAVRTTRRFLRDDPPRPRELRAIRHEIRRQLQDAMPLAARGDTMVAPSSTGRKSPSSSSCRRASTRRRTSAGPARSRRWARAWSTASRASRPTARRASSSGRSRTACGATVTSPPATTTSAREASTVISGSSRVASRSGRT